jgi:hypothetical protein
LKNPDKGLESVFDERACFCGQETDEFLGQVPHDNRLTKTTNKVTPKTRNIKKKQKKKKTEYLSENGRDNRMKLDLWEAFLALSENKTFAWKNERNEK